MIAGIRDIAITLACGAYIYTAVKGMAALDQLQGTLQGLIGG